LQWLDLSPPPAEPYRSSIRMKSTSVVPLVVAVLLMMAFVSVNRRGFRDQYVRPWVNSAAAPTQTYYPHRRIRNWPITCDVSWIPSPSNQFQSQTCVVRLATPFGFSSRWVVEKTAVTFVHGSALAINLLTGVIIVVGVFLGLRALCEKRQWTIRFSIRSGLLVTAIVAVGFALRDDVALLTGAFAFWDDLYEIGRSVTLVALSLGFVVSVLWIIVRLACKRSVVSRSIATNHVVHTEDSKARLGSGCSTPRAR
jgi:hypothetical protein